MDTDQCSTAVIAVFAVLSRTATSSPLPPSGTDSNGQPNGHRNVPEMIEQLRTDLSDSLRAAETLLSRFTSVQEGGMARIDDNRVLTSLRQEVVENFPENTMDTHNLTVMLYESYRNLSIICIFLEAMIELENQCDVYINLANDMADVKFSLLKTRRHMELTLSKQQSVTSLDNPENVLPTEVKTIGSECLSNESTLSHLDYRIIFATVNYIQVLRNYFVNLTSYVLK